METKLIGWNDTRLHTVVCKASTFGQTDKFLIKNKIIFSHSMGNLILASAIFNGVCDIDPSTTTWYAVAKPANGSTVAIALKTICADDDVKKDIAEWQGYCVSDQPSEAYITMAPTFPGLGELYHIFEDKLSGSLCGTSPFGLFSHYAPILLLVAKLGKLESPNDGLVWYDSCNIIQPGIIPSTSPTSPNYIAAINHADSSCVNGNGWWGDDRQPCTWYSNMV